MWALVCCLSLCYRTDLVRSVKLGSIEPCTRVADSFPVVYSEAQESNMPTFTDKGCIRGEPDWYWPEQSQQECSVGSGRRSLALNAGTTISNPRFPLDESAPFSFTRNATGSEL